MSFEPEVCISSDRVKVREGRKTLIDVPLERVVRELTRAAEWSPSCGILPAGIRLWHERGDATAVAVEVPPHARTVRWISDDSEAPFGPEAQYRTAFVAFPYVVLLLVFVRGALSEYQQLYYRTAPLGVDEELLLPNLYNVAEGYGQKCWVCLQHLRGDISELPWPHKIDAVVDHVFTAAFNQSSEVHEGNSYWGAMKEIDPRIATLEAWEKATREEPLFVLGVKWRPAGTTASSELLSMLDKVVRKRVIADASGLVGVISRTANEERQP